jgi:hypothetical protein
MKNFIYQVETTEPGCWLPIEAESHRDAAVRVASKFKSSGKIRINVADADESNMWPNGAPKKNHHFILEVGKK